MKLAFFSGDLDYLQRGSRALTDQAVSQTTLRNKRIDQRQHAGCVIGTAQSRNLASLTDVITS